MSSKKVIRGLDGKWLWLVSLAVLGTCSGSLSCGGSGGGGTSAPDADNDGLPDADELSSSCLDPNQPDTDGDGLTDGVEVRGSTDPCLWDSDADGLEDGFEVDLGTNPRILDLVSFLSGTVVFPDQQPAEGATVRIENDELSMRYPDLETTVAADGTFTVPHPWPTARNRGTFVSVTALRGDARYFVQVELPALGVGVFQLSELVVEFLPYTRGEDFFVTIPFLDSLLQTQIVVMAMMNPGNRTARVTWRAPGLSGVSGSSGSMTLQPHQATAVSLPGESLRVPQSGPHRIELVSKAVRVSSDVPITVAIQTFASDGRDGMASYSCLPTTAYGTEYYLLTAGVGAGFADSFGAYGMLSAGSQDSSITMTLSAPMDLFLGGILRLVPAGVPTPVSLELENSLQCVASGLDLTGSRFECDRPIGLLSGTTRLHSNQLGEFTGGNVVIQSLSPTNQWGSSFVTFGNIGSNDSRVYVIAGTGGADVTVGGAPPRTLLPGEDFSVLLAQNDATRITSDRPILVWQLFGWPNDGATGIHLAPTGRWSEEEVLWSFDAAGMENFMAVLSPASAVDDLTIDGQPATTLPDVQEIAVNSQFSMILAPTIGGQHRFVSSEPIFPIVFGKAGSSVPNAFFAYAYSTVW